jgi:predicted GIY-YIG superfamily endonuclease
MKQHKTPLLYAEPCEDKHLAAKRKKMIKGWTHQMKLELIKKISELALNEVNGIQFGDPVLCLRAYLRE